DGGWRAAFGGLRAGGIHDGPFRREFELARASVVSDEFSADRIHAADSLLLRRRVPGGMPDGRAAPHAVGRGGRDFAAAGADFSAARWETTGKRRGETLRGRSALARFDFVLRVF